MNENVFQKNANFQKVSNDVNQAIIRLAKILLDFKK